MVTQTVDVKRPRVAVTLPKDPQTGHSPMTHPPIYLARLNADSPMHNRSLLLTSYPPNINDFLLLEAIKPVFLKKIKKKIYDRINIIYIFGKCDVIKNSSDIIKVSSSSKPKGTGTVGFFLKNRFQINKIFVEPKYTLQIITLFLIWKQPFYRLKMSYIFDLH